MGPTAFRHRHHGVVVAGPRSSQRDRVRRQHARLGRRGFWGDRRDHERRHAGRRDAADHEGGRGGQWRLVQPRRHDRSGGDRQPRRLGCPLHRVHARPRHLGPRRAHSIAGAAGRRPRHLRVHDRVPLGRQGLQPGGRPRPQLVLRHSAADHQGPLRGERRSLPHRQAQLQGPRPRGERWHGDRDDPHQERGGHRRRRPWGPTAASASTGCSRRASPARCVAAPTASRSSRRTAPATRRSCPWAATGCGCTESEEGGGGGLQVAPAVCRCRATTVLPLRRLSSAAARLLYLRP